MKIIAKLSDMIEEELCDAEKYVDCSINWKEERPSLAATFLKLSIEEMNHVDYLHEQVVLLINEYRKEHGNPPERMQGIYDYIHKKHIQKANEIKVKQALAKESK